MGLVLDASATLAWLVNRVDATEARLADEILRSIQRAEAVVPALWFPGVANGVLVAERRGGFATAETASFMALVGTLPVVVDGIELSAIQGTVMILARKHGLTAYDATYLELAMRNSAELATFDRKLAEAARAAGVRVFGDAG